MRILGLASALSLLSFSSAALADEHLTLELPAFPQAQTAPEAESAPSPAPAAAPKPAVNPAATVKPRPAPPSPPNRRANPRATAESVVGRLGVAVKSVSIYQKRNPKSAALAKVPNGTYLALTDQKGEWYGVLMADRSTGWIGKSAIKLLDYEVVSNQPLQRAAPADYNPAATVNGGQRAILQTAYYYLGVPYKWGGESENGMDCSAFVQRCFRTVGINLPRTSREQVMYGAPVSPEELQPADRLYFANNSGRITHTGIYIGDGYFIHASSSRGGVAVSRLSEPMYRKMYFGARR